MSRQHDVTPAMNPYRRAYAGKHTIWKLDVSLFHAVVEMPKGARILTTQVQDDKLMLWALVDPNADRERRIFQTFTTGAQISEAPDCLRYITTFQFQGFVYHTFEVVAEGQR